MLFTPRLFVLNGQKERDILRKPALIGQSVCLVPRADCSFRRLRLAGRSADAKKAAILKVRNEALEDEDGIKLVLDNVSLNAENTAQPYASVWGYATHTAHNGRYLPETLAQRPHDNGTRLVRGLSGFEGQIWTQGNLVASRWWGRQPSAAQWDVFMRAARETLVGDTTIDASLPPAVEVPWRDDIPIFDIDKDRLSTLLAPPKLALGAATIAACFGLYTGGQYMRQSHALSQVNEKSAELKGETEQIQSARRRALGNMMYVRRYRAVGDNGTVLAGFGALSNVLGTTDMGIARISLRDGALEVRLEGEDKVSVPDVVTLLEAEPNLENVSVAQDGDKVMVVKAQLLPPRQTVAATPAAQEPQP
jgi:hypothetical protein